MKCVTLEFLKKLKACNSSLIKFKNTPELHNLDISEFSELITGDECLFDDVNYLNKYFKCKKLTFDDSRGNTQTYTYDDMGNRLTFEDSDGYTSAYTYDDKGNKSTFKNSNGFNKTYTHDDMFATIAYEDPDASKMSYTYDELGIIITDTYKTAKYDLSLFELK